MSWPASAIQQASVLVLMGLHTAVANLFVMYSTDENRIADVGATLTLRCEFSMAELSLFVNPVLWKKYQYNEESEMNILGNIKEPFESTGRFSVTLDDQRPKYILQMTIRNLSRVDTGNYTCEVKAPKSAQLGVVRYSLYIRAPVEEISIVQGNRSYDDEEDDSALTIVEGVPTAIRCIAKGGSPPPEMDVYLGQTDYTNHFRFDSVPTVSGAVGFRKFQMTTMLRTDDFRVTAGDNGKRLRCRAKVHGMAQRVTSAKIDVHFAPRINCTSKLEYIGERNVRLICEVVAQPPVSNTDWHFIIDRNGTTLGEGEAADGFWTLNAENRNSLQLLLYMQETKEESFRDYTIWAQNEIAASTATVRLLRKYRVSETKLPQSPAATRTNDDNIRPGRFNSRSDVHRPTTCLYAATALVSLTLLYSRWRL